MGEGQPIRVLIADDHELIRLSFHHVAQIHPAFEIVGEASTAEEAVRLCGELKPDVVFMDLMIPEMGGLEAIRLMTSGWPWIKVVTLSGYCEGEQVRDALRAGAVGYLAKFSFGKDDVVDAIRPAAAGETVMSECAARALAELTRRSPAQAASDRSLTRRERQVLELLVRGLSNQEISDDLGFSASSAAFHVNSIIRKLGARNRTEAAAKAVLLGLVHLRR